MVVSKRTPMAELPGRIYKSLLKPTLVLLTAALLLTAVFGPPAEARAIRFDFSTWTDRDDDLTLDMGFTFDPADSDSAVVKIDQNGQLLFADGTEIKAFDSFAPLPVLWQTATEPFLLDGDGNALISNGFRVCWGCEENTNPNNIGDNSLFELGLFALADGDFVMEFNYNALLAGSGRNSAFIGFETNLLEFDAENINQEEFVLNTIISVAETTIGEDDDDIFFVGTIKDKLGQDIGEINFGRPGEIFNENPGNIYIDDNGSIVTDSFGNELQQYGRILDINVDADGNLLNDDGEKIGNVFDPNFASDFSTNADGNIVDSDGNIIGVFIGETDGFDLRIDGIVSEFGFIDFNPKLSVFGANDNCSEAPTSLACNSVFGFFSSNSELDDYFVLESQSSFDAVGRYTFYFAGNDDEVGVPEPGTGALLLMGLGAMGALRRRQAIARVS